MPDILRLAILVSTRRSGSGAADRIAARAVGRAGFEVDVLDLADACLPEVAPVAGRPTPHAVRDLAPWLAAADAFIVLMPDTGGAVPAPLRAAVEWCGEECSAKPVAFVVACHACDADAVLDHLGWWTEALRADRQRRRDTCNPDTDWIQA